VNTGLCETGVAPCSGRVIETGIARGSLWNDEYRQYVKYVDNNGTNHVVAVDTTDIPGGYYYYLEVRYISTDDAWAVYRTTCNGTDYQYCSFPATKVYSVSASDAYVGFTTAASAYAGAAGQGQMPPQTLIGELWAPQYYNSGWQGWEWSLYPNPDRTTMSSCYYRVGRVYTGSTQMTISTLDSCP
jgi:hypothetical protein